MATDIGEIAEVVVTPDHPDHGGTADPWDPSGLGLHSNDYVIPGVATNHDPSGMTSNLDGLARSLAQRGAYQRALDQIGDPSVPPALAGFAPYLGPQAFAIFVEGFDQTARLHATMFPTGFFTSTDVQGLSHPWLRSGTRQEITRELAGGANVSHQMEMWLSPADKPAWVMGSGADDGWPIDLPDWGAPAPSNPFGTLSNPFGTPPSTPSPGDWIGPRTPAQMVNPELDPSELNPSNFIPDYFETGGEGTGGPFNSGAPDQNFRFKGGGGEPSGEDVFPNGPLGPIDKFLFGRRIKK